MATTVVLGCGHKVRADERVFGKKVRCPSCGDVQTCPTEDNELGTNGAGPTVTAPPEPAPCAPPPHARDVSAVAPKSWTMYAVGAAVVLAGTIVFIVIGMRGGNPSAGGGPRLDYPETYIGRIEAITTSDKIPSTIRGQFGVGTPGKLSPPGGAGRIWLLIRFSPTTNRVLYDEKDFTLTVAELADRIHPIAADFSSAQVFDYDANGGQKTSSIVGGTNFQLISRAELLAGQQMIPVVAFSIPAGAASGTLAVRDVRFSISWKP